MAQAATFDIHGWSFARSDPEPFGGGLPIGFVGEVAAGLRRSALLPVAAC